jgi:hypothetical protein
MSYFLQVSYYMEGDIQFLMARELSIVFIIS